MQITDELILLCLEELQKQIQDKKIYKNYYDGEHEILNNYDMQDSRSKVRLLLKEIQEADQRDFERVNPSEKQTDQRKRNVLSE